MFIRTQKFNYVNVYMRWKKDSYYDSIESINKSIELKSLVSLKNIISIAPNQCIPISTVSKKALQLDIPIRVATFLRQYPSVFEEFVGPDYNLPWFRLTPEAIKLHEEEKAVYEDYKFDNRLRLKKFILMSKYNRLPLKIIQGMQWYLGLPEDLLKNLEANLDQSFELVEIEDGLLGLAVNCEDKVLSLMQKNAIKRGVYSGAKMEPISFPLFPSRGVRLRRKIANWLDEFQKLPYVSPYEDFSHLDSNTDLSEKRIVSVIHELLSLFIDHSVERKKLFCLRKYLGLPQKFYKVFERHPHIFYLSLKNKTCTAILKEPYCDKSAIEMHPLLSLRNKYIRLMKESEAMLKNRRQRKRIVVVEYEKLDLESEEEGTEIVKSSL